MLQLTISPDLDPIDPRKDFDRFTKMYCSHRRYNLGDVQIKSEEELWRAKEKADWFLPLFLLDHSGLAINSTGFNDPWDSGQVGIITITKAQLEATGLEATEENAHKVMRQEVEEYDQYLRGDVWCYSITDTATDEVIDSLCGMYGKEYCEKEANEALKRLTERYKRMMPYVFTSQHSDPGLLGRRCQEEGEGPAESVMSDFLESRKAREIVRAVCHELSNRAVLDTNFVEDLLSRKMLDEIAEAIRPALRESF